MRCSAMLSLLLAVLACGAEAVTYTVKPDGTGDYPTIQGAIDATAAGDTVSLGNGVFTGTGNRDIDLSNRSIVVCSASGDPDSCVIDCEASSSDRHNGFLCLANIDRGTVIEGITIRHAYARTSYNAFGGGILCVGTSPTLRNLTLDRNAAHYGGGVYCDNGSCTLIENCLFEDNQSDGGKGAGFAGSESSVMIRDCVFAGNDAGASYGGAANFEAASADTLEGCDFRENWADVGGAIRSHDAQPLIVGCRFFANVAAFRGGAIQMEGGSAQARIQECVFQGNFAGEDGGACHIGACVGTISDCVFFDNFAYDAGGGLYLDNWEGFEITGCTFFGNGATLNGGGIWVRGSPSITRSIIANSTDGGGLRIWITSQPAISCCDIYGNTGGDWTGLIWALEGINGNLSADPSFCDPDNGDFHLWNYSPCNQYGCGLIGALPVGCWDVQAVDDPAWDAVPATCFSLGPITPNPCRSLAVIRYELPPLLDAPIRLAMFDASGRLVRTLVESGQGQGAVRWNGLDDAGHAVPTGIYHCRLSVGQEELTRRVVVVR